MNWDLPADFAAEVYGFVDEGLGLADGGGIGDGFFGAACGEDADFWVGGVLVEILVLLQITKECRKVNFTSIVGTFHVYSGSDVC
jgi:hypothetical protein